MARRFPLLPWFFGVLLGGVYGYFISEQQLEGIIIGFAAGGLVAAGIIYIEIRLFQRPALRRLSFPKYLFWKSVAYVVVILLGNILGQVPTIWFFYGADGLWRLAFDLPTFALSYLIAIIITLGFGVASLVGRQFLLPFLTGRYHTPREESRIFLLIDLVNSSALANRLGPLGFHRYLQDLFRDLSDAVEEKGGAVYRYVGDQLIASWPARSERPDPRPLEAAQTAAMRLAERGEDYRRAFGHAPAIRSVIHAGSVVVGELGFNRREIAYSGETLNQAAHLEKEAKAQGCDLLVTAAARQAMGVG